MLPLGFTAFVLFGGVLVLVGANQEALAQSLGLDLSRTGLLGATLSIGIALGVVAAGPLVDRLPRRPIFVASVLLAAGALGSVEREMGFARALLHVGLVGLGIGLYETLLNAVSVERYRDASSRPLSLLHAGATLGAIATPPIAGWIGQAHDWTWSFRAMAACYGALALWVAAVPLPASEASGAARARPAGGPPGADVGDASPSPVLQPAILALCVIGFAYVGVEGALTLFAVPYAVDALGLDPDRGRSAISAFWLGLLAGRLALGAYRGVAGARLLAAMGGGSVLVIAAGVGSGLALIELWVFAAGLALGGVFPLMVSLAGRAVPHAPGTASGVVVGCGALGGFVVPWLAGAVGDATSVAVAVGGLSLGGAAIAAAAGVAGAGAAPAVAPRAGAVDPIPPGPTPPPR